jgi:hypothetical protein
MVTKLRAVRPGNRRSVPAGTERDFLFPSWNWWALSGGGGGYKIDHSTPYSAKVNAWGQYLRFPIRFQVPCIRCIK